MVLPLLVGRRFQVLFHSPPGVLFTFPSRYWFTIGRQGVFSLGRWSSRIPTGFHVSRGTQGIPRITFKFRLPASHRLWGVFPDPSATLGCILSSGPLQPPGPRTRVWAPPLSLAATHGISQLISSPPGTEMFQFPGFASSRIREDDGPLCPPGFPIGRSSDQGLFSGSPKLIAAYHVLHRLLAPRHPPSALTSLTKPLKSTRLKPDHYFLLTPIRFSKIYSRASLKPSALG
jgi:hypothetical protein